MNAISHRQMLRTPEAAQYLGLTKSTLDKLRIFGDGPTYHKLGRVVVYSHDDLDQWLAARRRASTSAAA